MNAEIISSEVAERWHDVDGIFFSVYSRRVEGSGWQGRYFRYTPRDESLVGRVLDKISILDTRRGIYELQAPNRRKTPVTFTARETNGWINLKDRSGRRRMEFARSDIEALKHVFGILEEFKKSPETQTDHFCHKYGIEDDD